MTTIRRIILTLSLAAATFAACGARAESTSCDRAALARAEADAVTAERLAYETLDPVEDAVARQLVTAAVVAARAARALCASLAEDKAKASPFEAEVDPFEPVAVAPELDPAWCAVMGGCE